MVTLNVGTNEIDLAKCQFVTDKDHSTNCSRRVIHRKLLVFHTTKSQDVYQLELLCVSSLVGSSGFTNIRVTDALLTTLSDIAGDLTCPALKVLMQAGSSASDAHNEQHGIYWTFPYCQLNLKRTIDENPIPANRCEAERYWFLLA